MQMSAEEETENIIDLTKDKDGGVLKTLLKAGDEPGRHPVKGDTVWAHYVGTLKDSGKKFDSTRERDQPLCVALGRGQTIRGLELGMASMCTGERARLECRADYAYGERGSLPKVPGNATLVYELELIRWEGEDLSPDRDGTITKSIIAEGKKFDNPAEHGPVKAHIVGENASGRVFYDKELKFVLGEGELYQLPEGVDRAIRRMNRGEKARVTLKGRFGYGTRPPAEFQLGVYEEIVFTIFLKNYEKIKASWELLDEEKLEQAQKYKDRGTEFLNDGKYQLALNKYNAIITLIEHAKPSKPEDQGGREVADEYGQMLIAALLNCALANLRMGEPTEAIKFCDRVLEKKPEHVKALYRKGQALQQHKDLDEAIQVYQRVQQLEPDNKAAAQQILECRQRLAAVRDRERKTFKGIFDKLAKDGGGERETTAA